MKYCHPSVRTEFCSNKDVVMDMLQHDGRVLEFVAGELKQDFDIIRLALKKDSRSSVSILKEFLTPEKFLGMLMEETDRELLSTAIVLMPNIIRHPQFLDVPCAMDVLASVLTQRQHQNIRDILTPELFQSDADFARTLKAYDAKFWRFETKDKLADYDSMKKAVSECWKVLEFCSPELKKNADIVLLAVSQNGLALNYADPSMRKDVNVALEAVVQNIGALLLVDESFKDDFYFARNVILGCDYQGNWFTHEVIQQARNSIQKSARK
eukprot:CAMPEP_0206199088 /NCGR_PEP_ID=MMETSP0166-20121206/10046_1 /ASSEMBLY_ACC=CAM_ASM_000260 /TAXON_ID=95228 /ORGANISM="Vannella robusta, Strain DIVA3 518/3/11/1/6" /LENGTH=267 /DNA_ID=CAMNT_0053617109 /DNA_START=160 /DNA_END=963 /DNA_ORIENTATION=+